MIKPCPRCQHPLDIPLPLPEQLRCPKCGAVIKMKKGPAAAGEEAPCVVIPSVPAGSAILFTEALTHATAAWRGTHERRSLLYK